MKVVFLDFYGVMDGPIGSKWDTKRDTDLDPKCGALINKLCGCTEAVIVITSDAAQRIRPGREAWKENPFTYAKRLLVEIDVVVDTIIGCTDQPWDGQNLWDRPGQIRAWLDEHSEVTNYVIFDDMQLTFTAEDIAEFAEDIGKWHEKSEPEKWIARLPKPDPEAAERFIHIEGSHGLTQKDIDRALTILKEK